MALVNFIVCTLEQYKAANKNSNTLYFLTDAQQIYRGTVNMTDNLKIVSGFDTSDAGAITLANAFEGKLYLNATTFETRVKNNNAWIIMSPGYITDGTNFADASNNSKMATVGAIKDYITEVIKDITGGTAFVKGVTWDTTKHALVVDKGDTSPTEVPLTGLVYNPQYDASTLQISFSVIGETDPVQMNLPKDNFVRSGRYEPNYALPGGGTGPALVLVVNNGSAGATDTEVVIPAADLVNDYAGGTTNTTTVTIDANHSIQVAVKVDPAADNAITSSANGLKVDITGKADKLTSAAENHVLVADANGNIADSGAIVGGATLAATPNDTTLATEAAVAAALSWQAL